MPSYVLKTSTDPDEDLYCVYSTIVDAVTVIGTRAEIRQHLTAEGDHPMEADGRLARATALGSSCLIASGTDGGNPRTWYGFTDESLTIGRGELPRTALSAYCRALLADDETAAARLVTADTDGPPDGLG